MPQSGRSRQRSLIRMGDSAPCRHGSLPPGPGPDAACRMRWKGGVSSLPFAAVLRMWVHLLQCLRTWV